MAGPADPDGKAGGSARREHERRRARREAAVRARHPRLGGVILALQHAPRHEARWERGAQGEEIVERTLSRRCPHVPVLHDRRIPGSRANIDHIAVAATGVWVIDTKRYKGKVQVSKPRSHKPLLKIDGRNQTKLVDGLARQVEHVRAAIAGLGLEAPVHGCLCFVDGKLPLLGRRSIYGLSIVGRRRLVKRLTAPGELSPDDTALLAASLARHFPVA